MILKASFSYDERGMVNDVLVAESTLLKLLINEISSLTKEGLCDLSVYLTGFKAVPLSMDDDEEFEDSIRFDDCDKEGNVIKSDPAIRLISKNTRLLVEFFNNDLFDQDEDIDCLDLQDCGDTIEYDEDKDEGND